MQQPTPGPGLDDAGRIAEPMPCRTCGYDLQGLELTGTCPECSGSIRQSARGDMLRFSSPEWLRRLSRGMLVAVIGSIATSVLIVGTSMIGGIVAGMQTQQINALRVALGLAATLACGFTVVMVVGVWLVTQPDPKSAATDATLSARVLARYGILITIIAVPLQMLNTGTATTTTTLATVAFLLSSALSVLSLVGWVALLVHLRRLALRIPRPRLAKQTRFVMWGYALFTSLMTLGGAGAALLAPTFAGGGAGMPVRARVLLITLVAAAVIGFLLYIVFEIWFIILMCLYYAAFSAEAVAAERGEEGSNTS